ncbi:MAG: hypothetical protein WD603_01220 [Patescibacteria group bacterium]
MIADKDTRAGDEVVRMRAESVKVEPVKKVKPDGTRVTKDETGGIRKAKRPGRPVG